MTISRFLRSQPLRTSMQLKSCITMGPRRILPIASTCLALRQARTIQMVSASARRATKPTASIPVIQTDIQILFTEAPIAKLCDTLWMEKNVVGYKGAKRDDILKACLKKTVEEHEKKADGMKGSFHKEEGVKNLQVKHAVKASKGSGAEMGKGIEKKKHVMARGVVDVSMCERMELEEMKRLRDREDEMMLILLNQGVSTAR